MKRYETTRLLGGEINESTGQIAHNRRGSIRMK